jgi:hypothetical protein
MKSLLEWTLVLLGLACVTQTQAQAGHAAAAHGAGPAVAIEAFDETTWPRLIKSGPRPAAYLFTTSYCSTCPAAFEVIHAATLRSKRKPELAAVMMDVEGDAALRHATHFQGLTRLYTFDGHEPAIRRVVDPAWPNITPYVVLIDRQGRVQRGIGPPSANALRAWLQ